MPLLNWSWSLSNKKTSTTQPSVAFRIHQALRDARPELTGDDIAFLLAVSGFLGMGLEPTVVKADEFRVALSTLQSFLRTGKSKVVASRKKLEQLGIIEAVHSGFSADHVPATYRVHTGSISSGVPGQNADTCMAGFRGETPRGSDVRRRGVPGRDGMDLWDLSGEDQKKNATAVHDAPCTPDPLTINHVRTMIMQDVDLMRITSATDVDTIASEYLANADKIDVLKVIRKAGDYLRTDAGKKLGNGTDHLLRRLRWAIDASAKRKPPTPKSPPIPVDLPPLDTTHLQRKGARF
jgi:hypothetical protein